VERLERFFKIRNILGARAFVTRAELLAELEVSPATFKRDLEYMRDRMHLPIVWDAARQAYRLGLRSAGVELHELPGLWFSSAEVQALLTVDHLLSSLEPGLLGELLNPFRERIRRLVDTGDHSLEELGRRIRIRSMAARFIPPRYFELAASGTLGRKRLRITYFARGTGESIERVVSPQRLVHYRDNWYLDAWCHLRNGLRVFALDSIERATLLEEKAKDVSDAQLERELSGSYGIFAGTPTQVAVLSFSPERARWVAREQWHPDQKGRTEPDGRYVVEIPYSDDRELLMDILRHGAEVRVLAPEGLRRRVCDELGRALATYRDEA
jgi:predicted DNA-binding transcriptional regulator YafY